jgi:hypothetical protein
MIMIMIAHQIEYVTQISNSRINYSPRIETTSNTSGMNSY